MHVKFSHQLLEELSCVVPAVLNSSWQTEMISATGQDAAATILAYQQELDNDLLTSVFGRQALPPGKAADIQQFATIIEYISAADPGYFIAYYLSLSCESLLQVQRVGSIVHPMAFPGNCITLKGFGYNCSRPGFDLLLVRANIVEIAQARGSATHKAALFSREHIEHALHHRRIEQYIIIEIVNVRCLTLLKQKLPLLRQTSSRQVSMQCHLVPMPSECLH